MGMNRSPTLRLGPLPRHAPPMAQPAEQLPEARCADIEALSSTMIGQLLHGHLYE